MFSVETAERLALVLRCANGAADITDLRNTSEADWRALAGAAIHQGIAPYLHVRLTSKRLACHLPDDVVQTLRDEYLRISVENLKIYRELDIVLRCLGRQGIPVMLLKGVHLARFLYPQQAARPMVDIDILVRPSDLDVATDVLLKAGEFERSESVLSPETRALDRHETLISRSRIAVEIHRSVVAAHSDATMATKAVWERAGLASLDGVETWVMTLEDLLLHVCSHAAHQHAFCLGMIFLCDIAVILEHSGGMLDWDELATRAESWNAARGLWLTLRLARDVAGVAISDYTMERLRPDKASPSVVGWASERVMKGKNHLTAGAVSSTLSQFRAAGPMLPKIRYIFCRLVPPREEVARSYHVREDSLRLPLCYLRRLGDLVPRHAPSMWRLIRGDRETLSEAHRVNEEVALRRWLGET